MLFRSHLPKAWGRFGSLLRARPGYDIPKNELLDIFYNGLSDESRTYLDSCAGCVFRKRTVVEDEELMAKIAQNHDEWSIPEPPPLPTPKKRGALFLNPEGNSKSSWHHQPSRVHNAPKRHKLLGTQCTQE